LKHHSSIPQLDRINTTKQELSDLPAAFGATIPDDGIWVSLLLLH
jgi:hypothetical protein